jgi:hypothetical protein
VKRLLLHLFYNARLRRKCRTNRLEWKSNLGLTYCAFNTMQLILSAKCAYLFINQHLSTSCTDTCARVLLLLRIKHLHET